uniref:FAD-binding protein n=1 Tax=Pararhizobium sp. IMCC3301 TaxID=3067904 RepID=UPI0027413A4F|nr:FAD-binding protein [Pararhizobium sp. IMCC3301]
MKTVTPGSEEELIETIREAIAGTAPLQVQGSGSRAGLGRTVPETTKLSMAELSGITLLEPAEMVFSAKAGTPVSVVEAALAEHGQALTFEPMDHRSLYGTSGEPTIGAVAAGNISGPRRISAGAARDSLIGIRLVNGRGEMIKNGGRVMKNVTGLDLVKLLSGSWGTLGVLSEVTFKVLPKPANSTTLQLSGLADDRAIAALCRAMTSPFEPTGAAHLPAGIAGDAARTLVRLEGFDTQLRYRFEQTARHLAEFGKAEEIAGPDSEALWRDIRDVVPLAEPFDRAVWKISVAPTKGADIMRRFAEQHETRHFFDWSGGLIWVAIDPAEDGDAGAAALHRILAESGGHATLVRGPDELRARIDVFQPLSAPMMKLTSSIKQTFDPKGIFNPGFMYSGV